MLPFSILFISITHKTVLNIQSKLYMYSLLLEIISFKHVLYFTMLNMFYHEDDTTNIITVLPYLKKNG